MSKPLGNIRIVRYLFQNRGLEQTILKNTFWLAAAQGAAGLAGFVLTVVVIRKFGVADYGKFAYAFSLVSLFSTLFDMGLATAVTREFARDRNAERHFGDILILRILIGIAASVIVIAASRLIIDDAVTRRVGYILAVYIFTFELLNLFYAFFRARENMEAEAAFKILNAALLVILVSGVVFLAPSLINLGYAYAAANILTILAVVLAAALRAHENKILSPAMDFSMWKGFILIGWYLALTRVVGDIALYTDSVMLGHWGQIIETGWYNAASKIVRLLLFPMVLITTAVFPALVRARHRSSEDFDKLWKFWAKVTIFLAVMPSVIVFLYAEGVISLLFGPDFLPAAGALRMLTFMVSIVCITTLYYHVLLIFDQQKHIFYALFAGSIANVVLNAILIPRFSLNGAALATVITHAAMLLQYCRLMSARTTVKPADSQLLLTCLVAVVCGVLVYLISILLKRLEAGLAESVFCSAVVFSIFFVALERYGRRLYASAG